MGHHLVYLETLRSNMTDWISKQLHSFNQPAFHHIKLGFFQTPRLFFSGEGYHLCIKLGLFFPILHQIGGLVDLKNWAWLIASTRRFSWGKIVNLPWDLSWPECELLVRRFISEKWQLGNPQTGGFFGWGPPWIAFSCLVSGWIHDIHGR